jgi:hypothetical protein
MRRRLGKFLPIVMLALVVQILAPIGACWAASIAASDPLSAAVICHGAAAGPADHQSDQADHRAHDGACSLCCAAHVGASLDTPDTFVVAVPYRQLSRVVWQDLTLQWQDSRAGGHAQARAPPSVS